MTTSAKTYEASRDYAQSRDRQDPLHKYRDQFLFPVQPDGTPHVYLCGNSLGLQPKSTRAQIDEVLSDWEHLGVEGHFHAKNSWVPYHTYMTEAMARVVGGKPAEVVVMNTLTVNLHLMLVSFYRPTPERPKIIIEADAFPSDKYAVQSQIRFHGYDPDQCLIEVKARPGEVLLRPEDIQSVIEEEGDQVALVMFGNTNYYTGQYYNIHDITRWGHAKGCMVGFDCAHAAGNIDLQLHDSGCDFAVWCNYKYLNCGPGGISGAFVHERHLGQTDIPRFEGWWGHNAETRFEMRGPFDPIPTAEAWNLSNAPILSLAGVWSSLKMFDEAGMANLRAKSIELTGYLEFLVKLLGEDQVDIITPSDPQQRGCQLSIRVKNADRKLFDYLTEMGVIADWREPDVIRIAPTPMYNSFTDVYRFYELLGAALERL